MKAVVYMGSYLGYEVPFQDWDDKQLGEKECAVYENYRFDKLVKTTLMESHIVKLEGYRDGRLVFTEEHASSEDFQYQYVTTLNPLNPDAPIGEFVEIDDNEDEIKEHAEWNEALVATNVIYPLIIFGNYEFKAFSNITSFKDLALRWAQKGYYDDTMLQTCVTKNKLTIDEYNEITNAINNA